MKSILAAQGNSGNLQLLCLPEDQGVGPYLIWQSAHDGSWNPFGNLDTQGVGFSKLTAAANSSALFVIGLGQTDGLPYWITQDTNGTWRYLGMVPGTLQGESFIDATIGMGYDEIPQLVLLRATDNKPVLFYLVNGAWSRGGDLTQLAPTAGPIARVYSAYGNGVPFSPGNLQVIGIEPRSGQLAYIDGAWQSARDGSWDSIPTLVENGGLSGEAAMATGNDGNLQLIYVQDDGLLGLVWQSDDDGSWNQAGTLPNNPGGTPIKFLSVAAPSSYFVSPFAPFMPLLMVIGIGVDQSNPNGPSDAFLIYQDADGGWHWGGVLVPKLGDNSGFRQATVGVCNGGVQVLLLDPNGQVYLFWQNDAGSPNLRPYGVLVGP